MWFNSERFCKYGEDRKNWLSFLRKTIIAIISLFLNLTFVIADNTVCKGRRTPCELTFGSLFAVRNKKITSEDSFEDALL